MTFSSQVNSVKYNTDGVTDDFNITFEYDDASYVKVLAIDNTTFATSEPTISVTDPDPVTKTGVATTTGGPIATGSTLFFYRSSLPVQPADYDGYTSFPATLHEAALDRRARAEVDLRNEQKRTMRFPIVDEMDMDLLPAAEIRAGKGIKFDANGQLILTDYDPDTTAIEAAQAQAWALVAQMFAENPEDAAVTGYPGEYSALHWAAKAAASAAAAALWDPANYYTKTEQDATDAAQDALIAVKYDSSDLASQAQAEAGADNTTLMTPLRTKQALDAIGLSKMATINEQDFNVDGTWSNTAEPNGKWVLFQAWGGAGGGGEAEAAASSAQGGQGGYYRAGLFSRQSIYSDQTVLVGLGGAGAAPNTGSSTGAGAAGGMTTIGDVIGAGGGDGGDSNVATGEAAPKYYDGDSIFEYLQATSSIGVDWQVSAFYATPEAIVAARGAPAPTAGANGIDSLYAGASGAGAINTAATTRTGGVAQIGPYNGGDFDYTTGPTAGDPACGGAAGRAGQGGAAGGDGFAIGLIFR